MIFPTPFQTSGSGVIRNQPDEFIVKEIPLFTPSGDGEHLWLRIQKINSNTDWVAGQLARLVNVKRQDVGFAGLKDRHAITTQWFSIYLPGKEIKDLTGMVADQFGSSIKILEQTRHLKKLRKGTLKGNHFTIIVRDVLGDQIQIENTFSAIKQHGIANYLGEQRFGHDFANIEKATAWFNGVIKKPKNRNQRGIYLSAARSWVFNHILAKRVLLDSWDKASLGDVFMLNRSHSWFVDDIDKQIIQRVKQMDIHPSGSLWGRGQLNSKDEVLKLETDVAEQYSILCQGLEKNGLKQERRALRVSVDDLELEWLDKTSLKLQFSLPPGSYATVLLSQLIGTIT
jgi:tRNA pseudouridine13 synthase